MTSSEVFFFHYGVILAKEHTLESARDIIIAMAASYHLVDVSTKETISATILILSLIIVAIQICVLIYFNFASTKVLDSYQKSIMSRGKFFVFLKWLLAQILLFSIGAHGSVALLSVSMFLGIAILLCVDYTLLQRGYEIH